MVWVGTSLTYIDVCCTDPSNKTMGLENLGLQSFGKWLLMFWVFPRIDLFPSICQCRDITTMIQHLIVGLLLEHLCTCQCQTLLAAPGTKGRILVEIYLLFCSKTLMRTDRHAVLRLLMLLSMYSFL